MKRLRTPRHAWIPFAVGVLLFAVTHWLPGMDPARPEADLFQLDQGYVEALRSHPGRYSVLEDQNQAFGAHVLTRLLLTGLSTLTGDQARSGIWLSLVGLIATLAALYPLCRSVLPLRGFALAAICALAGAGAMRDGLSPDPSQALGMALVSWGVALFVSSLHRNIPERMFLSATLVALAGYLRIELSLLWVLLALYLVALAALDSHHRDRGFPLLGMALGGLLMVALLLWPLLHRNLLLTGTPILPGGDSERIFGAEAGLAGVGQTPPFVRLGQGIRMLAVSPTGVGIFLGMLWPVGLLISTFINRHRAAPAFWLPVLGGWLLLLTLLSPVTGEKSFLECLRISVPLFLPFAVLVPVYGYFQWLQADDRRHDGLPGWWILALGVYLLALIPGVMRSSTDGASEERDAELLQYFAGSTTLKATRLLTDQPGMFLAAGKRGVYGLNGETDWEILTAKYDNGEFKEDALITYLQTQKIGLIHLSDPMYPLIDKLELAAGNRLRFRQIDGISPPHRVYQLRWP